VRAAFGEAILDELGRAALERWGALNAGSPVPPVEAPPTPAELPLTKQEIGARWQRRREEHEATLGKPE
jgi:hypothetical protein